ncbi:hypothetical protein BGX27_002601 [Mortierella sp. AM989]|nr:hypothetical protein BGX27_002601 [Mortierella sp. AM989]
MTPTATSWASMPPSLADAEQTVEEFLSQIQDKQQEQEQQLQQQKSDNTMDMEVPYNLKYGTNSAVGSTNSLEGNSISASSVTESILDPLSDPKNTVYLTSVLRKRRIKMRKHKYNKLRKRTRALRRKLGK